MPSSLTGRADITRRPVLDRSFAPVHPYEHYRVFMFEFDVCKLWRLVDGWPLDTRRDRLHKLNIPGSAMIDDHIINLVNAMEANMSIPLLATMAGKSAMILDGWSRCYKARSMRRRHLYGFLFNREEVLSVMVGKKKLRSMFTKWLDGMEDGR